MTLPVAVINPLTSILDVLKTTTLDTPAIPMLTEELAATTTFEFPFTIDDPPATEILLS